MLRPDLSNKRREFVCIKLDTVVISRLFRFKMNKKMQRVGFLITTRQLGGCLSFMTLKTNAFTFYKTLLKTAIAKGKNQTSHLQSEITQKVLKSKI